NLQADPERLPGSLLHHVVSLLTLGRRDSFAETPLFDLARAGLVAAAGGQTRFRSWDPLARLWNAWVDRLALAGHALTDRRIYDALFAFFRSAFEASRASREDGAAALGVRWLSGLPLEPDEARVLRLPPGRRRDEPVALEDAEQYKQVLVALTRLA